MALGARIQGKNIACLTYIGDGGQSTGPTYEGFNFAAVQKLGVILMVEHNLWAYSTPVKLQFACKDLADRSIGYGVPGVIVDGTDANQVYDATYEAVQRAYRGEGATLIEAKMMRMKGHAMHDAARLRAADEGVLEAARSHPAHGEVSARKRLAHGSRTKKISRSGQASGR